MKKHLTLLDKLLRDSLVSLCFFPSEVSGANQWPPPNLTTRPTGFISSFTKSMNLLYGLLALLTRHHSTDIFTVHSVFISKNIYHVLSLKYSFRIPIPLTPMKCAMIFPSIKKINVQHPWTLQDNRSCLGWFQGYCCKCLAGRLTSGQPRS